MSLPRKDVVVSSLKKVLDGPPNAVTHNNNKSVTAHLVVDAHCQLGECILYDDRDNTILWTDILGECFFQLPLFDESTVQAYPLPKRLCSFTLLQEDEQGYLCAWEDGFQVYDVVSGVALGPMSVGECVNPSKGPTRLNDGRCDPEGRRFICGGYYGDMPGTKMKVYRCELAANYQLVHEPIVNEIEVTNSICFSNDGKTMFLADSPTRSIHAFHYDTASGNLSGKKLVHQTPVGVPDGSCVDMEGFLWNAVWRDGAGPGMVNRIDPTTGEVVFTVHVPDTTSQVSCCCFGGRDMDILFITSASVNRDIVKEPHAGAVYAIKVGVKGRKEARFQSRQLP